MTRRPTALLAATALLAGSLVAPLAGSVATAQQPGPAERTVTLVGSLQDELGCEEDWDPACEDTTLAPVEGSATAYAGVFEVPAGTYEYKVALDGGWEESHPSDNLPLVIEGPASLEFSFDTESQDVGVAPTELSGPVTEEDAVLATDSLREAVTGEQFYFFVLADRFANGDPTNDTGGLAGDRLESGFDPTDKGFYHGGDLAGISDRLDYIEDLGTTAIWLTPSFKNQSVQGVGPDASAGYHGYWITDFTQIDPHLGTNAEMEALVDEAHARGMKVYFDIITNHTADVIDYAEGEYSYVSKEAAPYTDAAGQVFDDSDYAGTDTFPEVDPATSFPYTPTFRTEADRDVKVPEFLNDPRMYHNRGDSTFAGESSLYGDFVGLDDLWTERPEVVDGMIDIYSAWADFGIDGFRIDTVKHVNMEFWQEFSPAVLEAAREGNEDFFMFGEVYDADPAYLSSFTTEGQIQAVIDFGFQARSVAFATGAPTTGLRDFYALDDYYTDTDSNAYQLPTFTGNHDMGRMAMMLAGEGFSGDDLQSRVELSNELMFLTRGQPVIYYGDEQGFVGAGGDKDARQDMFATQTQQYAEEPVIGGPSGSRDRYDTGHPLYTQIAGLAQLREEHPTLVDGAQIHRYASSEEGVYAFSRIDAEEQVEYVVVANNSTSERTVSVPTYHSQTQFRGVHGDDARLRTDTGSRLEVAVDPLSVEVYRAGTSLPRRQEAPAVQLTDPSPGGVVGGRAEIGAAVPGNASAQVTFLCRPVGTTEWSPVGTDDNAPYRVFHDLRRMPEGTLLEYRAVLRDSSDNLSADSSSGVVGEPAPGGGGGGSDPGGPVEQPEAVSVPGDHNSEMGCPGDWQPECDEAQLSLDDDLVWKGSWDIPAGDHEYKAAIDWSWDENYGAGGAPGGANIPYTAPGGSVSFYYDHRTHWVTSDAQDPIATAAGSFQSELGCPADWSPDCMRSWLQDPDGDGTYTFATTAIPAGNYEYKVAHGLSWEENYGAGGVPDGDNVAFSVPSDGVVVTISYDLETHEMTVQTSQAGVAPDLTSAKAHWLQNDLLAVPAQEDPLTTWRLHTAPEGGLAIDAEAVTGGSTATLTPDPDGLPEEVVEDFPHLAGYTALRLDRRTSREARDLLTGQVAVGTYDDLGRLLDATGVQIPGVLDDLYADRATRADLGTTWRGDRPTLRLWAPTATAVDALVFPEGSAADAPVEEAERVPMKAATDGSWSVRGPASWTGRSYLYQVTVFVPATGEVETNVVTDPYSVALTLNSTRSVVVDLDDDAWRPELWRTATPPVVEREVDQSIYELHVRDFSIGDPDVPEGLRGSYLAFAEDGYGMRHLEAQSAPDCDLESFAPDSTEQQACVQAAAGDDAFNWGYDPWALLRSGGLLRLDGGSRRGRRPGGRVPHHGGRAARRRSAGGAGQGL